MLTMTNWHIKVPQDDEHIGYTGDNLAKRIVIQTDIDQTWMVKLDVQIADSKNTIDLMRDGNLLYVDLTREMLQKDGIYQFQLRGTCGDIVTHSNIWHMRVRGAINAVSAFPSPLPSEFYQMEQRVTALKNEAEDFALNPPVISESGNWLVYSEGGYIDSGFPSQGQSPHIGVNGNWWIGDTDTDTRATASPPQALTNEELEAMLQ